MCKNCVVSLQILIIVCPYFVINLIVMILNTSPEILMGTISKHAFLLTFNQMYNHNEIYTVFKIA